MNMQISQQKRRIAGAAGVSGALLFFAGDMLFYGHLGLGAGFHDGMLATVRNASLARLFAGGLVGPVAACLCIIGFWHVYLNVRPSAALLLLSPLADLAPAPFGAILAGGFTNLIIAIFFLVSLCATWTRPEELPATPPRHGTASAAQRTRGRAFSASQPERKRGCHSEGGVGLRNLVS
jgi:hypothetical protein